MKSLSSGLLATYAGDALTLVTLMHVTRRDGEIFGFTSSDKTLTYDGVVYEYALAMTPSALQTSADLSVDNMELTGLRDPAGIELAEIEAGLWDGAAFEIFEVNALNLAQGRNVLLTGEFGQFKPDRAQFIAELRSLTAKLQKNVGRFVLPTCGVKLGSTRCGVDLTSYTFTGETVSSVTSRRVFVSTDLSAESPNLPTGWFDWGVVTFTTGANAGFSQDVKTFIDDGTITLQLAFPYDIEVGDEFTISPGCNKLWKAADGTYTGDCIVKFGRANFQGFPEVPGSNAALKLPGAA